MTCSPAAFDTLTAFFQDTQTTPNDYDLVLTGDLGALGHSILRDLMEKSGLRTGENFQDCGLLLYDREKQDMHAGGSGAGCSASVLCAYLLEGIKRRRWKKVIFAPTGALLSPTTTFQKESIPAVCHAVVLSAER